MVAEGEDTVPTAEQRLGQAPVLGMGDVLRREPNALERAGLRKQAGDVQGVSAGEKIPQ